MVKGRREHPGQGDSPQVRRSKAFTTQDAEVPENTAGQGNPKYAKTEGFTTGEIDRKARSPDTA
jgi:hypothetical protein